METKVMRLPADLEAMVKTLETLERKSFSDLYKNGFKNMKSRESNNIIQYSFPAVLGGYPLDQVMIVLVGESGTGKSSTINRLFEDDTLCRVSSDTSETSDVILCTKRLNVASENPTIQANLHFVDVPGFLDTNYLREENNFSKISEFRHRSDALRSREYLKTINHSMDIPTKVYPNIVLFVFNCGDTRMVGPDSKFVKSLKLLSTHDLVNFKKPNLVAVGTHAIRLGSKKEKFCKNAIELRQKVKQLVYEHLRVYEVPIVFVENDFEELEKPINGSDFGMLPDESLSHQNLILIMMELFDNNKDMLGLLLTSWYFNPECPDRIEKDVTPEVFQPTSASYMGENLTHVKALLNTIVAGSRNVVPEFCFQSLGYGYCPVTEARKPHSFLKRDHEMTTLELENSKFCIPSFTKHFKKDTYRYLFVSCTNKSEYELKKSQQYKLEAGVPLVVHVDSIGRWSSTLIQNDSETLVSVLYEKPVCTVQIDEPDEWVSDKFKKELLALPLVYNEETSNDFKQFFGRYGTHFVYQLDLGGCIRLDCYISYKNVVRNSKQTVEAAAKGILESLLYKVEYTSERGSEELKAIGVTKEQLVIEGGECKNATSISEITPQELQAWLASVQKFPCELGLTKELYPYYNIKTDRSQALRSATLDYMSNKLSRNFLNTRVSIASEMADLARHVIMYTFFPFTVLGEGCFTGATEVITKSGKKPIDKLDLVEDVLTISGTETRWTRIMCLLHKDDQSTLKFLVLKLETGKELYVTEKHLIFVAGPKGEKISKLAYAVGKGDHCFQQDTKGGVSISRVVGISKVFRQGAYTILTTTGTFLADGMLVSSYANVESFQLAHALFAPLVIWTFIKTKNGDQLARENGIHPYALKLMKLNKILNHNTVKL